MTFPKIYKTALFKYICYFCNLIRSSPGTFARSCTFLILWSNDSFGGLIKNLRERNPLNCAILDSWVFENFILAVESLSKAFWIFDICVLVNNSLHV